MGFSEEEIDSDEAKKKRGVAANYYTLLVDLLQVSLQSFDGYQCDQQREFAENFCAYAYFAIPQFRNLVLAVITRTNDPEIE